MYSSSIGASGIRQSVNLSSSYSNLSELDNAKLIARRLFELYDKDKSSLIEGYEITPMLQDTYRYMNRAFNPSKLDIDSYFKVLDRNGDGRITLGDIESLCVRYLVGEQTNKLSESVAQKPVLFPAVADQQVDRARGVFKKYEVNGQGFLEDQSLGDALEESYRAINQSRKFGAQELDQILQSMTATEGRVTAQEFEQIFLRSLGAKWGCILEEETLS